MGCYHQLPFSGLGHRQALMGVTSESNVARARGLQAHWPYQATLLGE
jgi:hypothetical protein